MPRPEDILRFCGSLVRLSGSHDSRASIRERAKDRTFSIAHASVVDFLQQGSIRIGSAKDLCLTSEAVHIEMATIFWTIGLNKTESGLSRGFSLSKYYPFAVRDADFWAAFHISNSMTKSEDRRRMHRLIDTRIRRSGMYIG